MFKFSGGGEGGSRGFKGGALRRTDSDGLIGHDKYFQTSHSSACNSLQRYYKDKNRKRLQELMAEAEDGGIILDEDIHVTSSSFGFGFESAASSQQDIEMNTFKHGGSNSSMSRIPSFNFNSSSGSFPRPPTKTSVSSTPSKTIFQKLVKSPPSSSCENSNSNFSGKFGRRKKFRILKLGGSSRKGSRLRVDDDDQDPVPQSMSKF